MGSLLRLRCLTLRIHPLNRFIDELIGLENNLVLSTTLFFLLVPQLGIHAPQQDMHEGEVLPFWFLTGTNELICPDNRWAGETKVIVYACCVKVMNKLVGFKRRPATWSAGTVHFLKSRIIERISPHVVRNVNLMVCRQIPLDFPHNRVKRSK